MRLPFHAARLHVRASSHLTRHLKGRHHGGERRGAAQPAGAQRAAASGRAAVGLLDRLLRRLWQRVKPPAAGQILPLPVQPPTLRTIAWITLLCIEPSALAEGVRPYLLRPHAQARWRRAPGWA